MKKINKYCGVCKLWKSEERHHILPRYLGGEDEENNLIDLCGGCHKYAPDSPEEFIKYKARGGFVWDIFKMGYLSAKANPKKSLWIIKLETIRNKRLYDKEFERRKERELSRK